MGTAGPGQTQVSLDTETHSDQPIKRGNIGRGAGTRKWNKVRVEVDGERVKKRRIENDINIDVD